MKYVQVGLEALDILEKAELIIGDITGALFQIDATLSKAMEEK